MTVIDQLFLRVRSGPFFYRFTLFTRVLLAAGFIPTGMVKLLGQRFTLITPDHPIGAFFEAMFQTGMYWQFLGLTQVTAGVLLLLPRTAHLGAAMFFGVILNIFIITLSLDFQGTPIVVGLMLLAVTWLCAWDWHRFRSLFTLTPLGAPVPVHRLDRWELAGFVTFSAALVLFFGATRSFGVAQNIGVVVGTGLIAGLATLGRFLWLRRAGRLAPTV
jgi:hypothetical protein